MLIRDWSSYVGSSGLLFAIGQYFYTGGCIGCGRIDTVAKAAVGPDGVRRGIFNALARGQLDQKMSIHDAIGRKVLPALGGEQLATYNQIGRASCRERVCQ